MAPARTAPICCQQLPLSEFGICRARHDGRNLYCKSCIRKKVTDSRRALKEYRSARKRGSQVTSEHVEGDSCSATYPRMLNKLSPAERVKEAIRKGAKTQKQIRTIAKLGDDEVGEALANLLLWTREITTEIVENTRHYYLNEAEASPLREQAIPARKRDVPSSFSAIQGLMPGRNPEGEPEKIGGWVAA